MPQLSAVWMCQASVCRLTKMKIKFIHPLWTHLPALLLIAAAAVFTVTAFPLPDPAPTHFDINGKPDAYGSPWTSPLPQLKTGEITAVELHYFSALHDFGGYGIRRNSGIQAYFLKGDRGVPLPAASGRKYLLGPDGPEQLAAVIDGVVNLNRPGSGS